MDSESPSLGANDASPTNPTRQQRAVYSWHEARNSGAADDIFSNEWFERTRSFLVKHPSPNSPDVKLESLEKVEDLEFGAFFIEHPIAAFALWQFLQACYALDRVVCINPLSYEDVRNADENRIKDWETLPPFQYMNACSSKDGKIRRKWTTSTEQLRKEINHGALEGEMLVTRLYDMYTGVDRLKSSVSALRDGFDESLKGIKFRREMLDRAENVVNERVKILSLVLKLDQNEPAPPSASEGVGDQTLDLQENSAPTDISRRQKESSPPPTLSARPRKSNKRVKKPRASSPNMDRTTESVHVYGRGIGISELAKSKTAMDIMISFAVFMALSLALFMLFLYYPGTSFQGWRWRLYVH